VAKFKYLGMAIQIWRPGPSGWGLEHRASNPVSIKNLNATETSTASDVKKVVEALCSSRERRGLVVVVVVVVVVSENKSDIKLLASYFVMVTVPVNISLGKDHSVDAWKWQKRAEFRPVFLQFKDLFREAER
jgi:hypothetical protein